MDRHRSTKLELRAQLAQIQEVLDRYPDGLSAAEIRDSLEEFFDLRLDARLLRLRLAKLLATGSIAAHGATRGRRYRTTTAHETWEGVVGTRFQDLPGHTKRNKPALRPPSPPRLHKHWSGFEAPHERPENEAPRAHYVSSLRWRGRAGYFIEFERRDSAFPDSLHMGPTGRIPTFSSILDATIHAEQMGFELDDPARAFGDYDLDHIDAWCANPRPEDIEYELFVHVLGLIAQLPDIEFDEELAAAHDGSELAFSKLVKSTDSALLPGEPFPYIAEWTPRDIASMRRTFQLGARAFVNRLVNWPPRL